MSAPRVSLARAEPRPAAAKRAANPLPTAPAPQRGSSSTLTRARRVRGAQRGSRGAAVQSGRPAARTRRGAGSQAARPGRHHDGTYGSGLRARGSATEAWTRTGASRASQARAMPVSSEACVTSRARQGGRADGPEQTGKKSVFRLGLKYK